MNTTISSYSHSKLLHSFADSAAGIYTTIQFSHFTDRSELTRRFITVFELYTRQLLNYITHQNVSNFLNVYPSDMFIHHHNQNK